MDDLQQQSQQAFKPPPAFIQASLKRQAELKEKQERRQESNASLNGSGSDTPPQQQQQQQRGHGARHVGLSSDRENDDAARGKTSSLTPSGNSDSRHRSSGPPTAYFSSRRDDDEEKKASRPPPIKRTLSNVKTTLSKTALRIEELRKAREERRSKQAQIAKAKEGLNDRDQIQLTYRRQIEEFRASLKTKTKTGTKTGTKASERRNDKKMGDRDDDEGRDARIRVCVRKRPMKSSELGKNCLDIVTPGPGTATYRSGPETLFIHEPKTRLDLSHEIDTHSFKFDKVFGETSPNDEIYEAVGRPLVRAMAKGGRATLFAYGQLGGLTHPDAHTEIWIFTKTGSGKTHTIFGEKGGRVNSSSGNRVPGLYELACEDIFRFLSTRKDLRLYASFFEIYGGRIYDLFGDRGRVTLLEDGAGRARVRGLREIPVPTLPHLLDLIGSGNEMRTTASTEANATSSRSHAVFQIALRRIPVADAATTATTPGTSPSSLGPLYGKFSLIDLAGSERGADTGNASRQARIEASDINVSLLALKECIRALHKRTGPSNGESGGVDGNDNDEGSGTHIPFRASKLTQILRESLVGKGARTVMIANVAPSDASSEHTLNTLRYAARVKDFPATNKAARATGSTSSLASRSSTGEVGGRSKRGEDVNEGRSSVERGDENGYDDGDDELVEDFDTTFETDESFGRDDENDDFDVAKNRTDDSAADDDVEGRASDDHEYEDFDVDPTPLPEDRPGSGSSTASHENEDSFRWSTSEPVRRGTERTGAQNRLSVSTERSTAAVSSRSDADDRAPASPSDADLAFLHRRLNSPTHVTTLHFAVDHLLAAEDALLRDHERAIRALSELALEVEQPLIDVASRGGIEIDAYAARLAQVVDRKITILYRLRSRIDDVSRRLSEEEEASVEAFEKDDDRGNERDGRGYR